MKQHIHGTSQILHTAFSTPVLNDLKPTGHFLKKKQFSEETDIKTGSNFKLRTKKFRGRNKTRDSSIFANSPLSGF